MCALEFTHPISIHRAQVFRHCLVVAAALFGPFGIHAQEIQADAAGKTQITAFIEPSLYGSLRFRHIGPEGNRVSAVAGVTGDPNVYYAGAASGGIWRTSDGGVHWESLFDGQPVQSIGALAVAPSDQNVVWAGTGEPHIRSNISLGWGIFKSTDRTTCTPNPSSTRRRRSRRRWRRSKKRNDRR